MSEDKKETIKVIAINGSLFLVCVGISVWAYKVQAKFIAKEVVKLLPTVL